MTESAANVSGNMPAPRPLRVVVAHCQYQQRGGEDTVVEAEVAMLRQAGHEVHEYQRSNADVDQTNRALLAAQTLWSSRTSREMAALFTQFRPDVLHVHNTLPLISPSIYWAAQRAGVPVVQTLHNFRLLCPQALLLREGKVCEDCVGKVPWRGAVHGCYRSSVLQTSVLGGVIALHRAAGTWRHKVTRYIALNDFCRNKFIQGGLPADKIVVKPNFVDLPTFPEVPRHGFLFVGRLSMEKGIDVLAQAISQKSDARLRVLGSGPEQHRLESLAGVSLLGPLGAEAVYAHMRSAVALVLPSIWYENFPRTLVEAFACGLPVIASRIGALASLVEDGVTGLLFEPGNASDLAEKMKWVQDNPSRAKAMGHAARTEYESKLTGPSNLRTLLGIYCNVMKKRDGAFA